MTEKDKQRIIKRLETQPTDTDNAAQFVDWYKEDVPLLMDELRELKALTTVQQVIDMNDVVKAARDMLDSRNEHGFFEPYAIARLDHALRVLDGKE